MPTWQGSGTWGNPSPVPAAPVIEATPAPFR